jgi:helix-turn-helix, Psq domain
MTTQTLTPDEIKNLLTSLPPGSKIEIMKSAQGGIMVTTDQPKTKAQLLDEKYAHLKGQGITLSQAAKKYDVPRGAIQGWVYQSSYISFVDQDSYPQTIDEAEVALCAEIYKDRQKESITGIPFFDEQGHLIEGLKHPDLSEYRRRKREKKS